MCHSSWVIVYEDDLEEEVLQPDGETINLKRTTRWIRLGENKYRVTSTDDERQGA